ncbi:MAG: carbohydrate kinase family protein [Deinococcus sp.]|nr:carbohydrate kinase family protein [Deinococcus sp.]
MPKFAVVGDVSVDQIYLVDALPESGMEIIAREMRLEPGGGGGNVAAALLALDQGCTLIGRVGKDELADIAQRNLKDNPRANVKYLQVDRKERTGIITILIDPAGSRTTVGTPGANANLDPKNFDPESVDQVDALVLSAYSLVEGKRKRYSELAIARAKEQHKTIFIELSTGAVERMGGSMITHVVDATYLVANEHEVKVITATDSISQAVAKLHQAGIEQVVIKVGPQGALVLTPQVNELVEPYAIEGVVDRTGAGDAFTAALAYAVMDGYEILDAVKIANIAGAVATTAVGAQNCLPNMAEIKKRLK